MSLVILPESHVDHFAPLSLEDKTTIVATIVKAFKDRPLVEGFQLFTVEGPFPLPCELVGPVMGQEPVSESLVRYEARNGRSWPSRLVRREPVLTTLLTIVVGPHNGHPHVLYTAYPGPPAPREPQDPSLKGKELEESQTFWATHALTSNPNGCDGSNESE